MSLPRRIISLIGKFTYGPHHGPRRRPRLRLERLDDRVVPALVAPVLNSDPGAALSLYLDFDGHEEVQWIGTDGTVYDSTTLNGERLDGVVTPAFNLDADPDNYSRAELDTITEVFRRVAEDYAPFDINVTTVEPSAEAFSAGTALRVAIGGHTDDWLGGSSTGKGRIGSFTDGSGQYVVYVFSEQIEEMIADGELDRDDRPIILVTAVANTVAHEAGHGFGLEHQLGLLPNGNLQLYYEGTDEWTPIMGSNLVSDRTTWYSGVIGQNGDILSTQDDMAVLADVLGYREDEAAVTALRVINTQLDIPIGGRAARALNALAGSREAAVTLSGSGIIAQMTDEDAFSFSIDRRTLVRFHVDVASVGPNLDVKVEIRDLLGNVIARQDPADSLGATIDATLPAGEYRLVVMSHGGSRPDDASPFFTYDVGQYTIRGTIGGTRLGSNSDPVTKGVGPLWPRGDDPRWFVGAAIPTLRGPREQVLISPPSLTPVQKAPTSSTASPALDATAMAGGSSVSTRVLAVKPTSVSTAGITTAQAVSDLAAAGFLSLEFVIRGEIRLV
jgi:hypothetical protein